METRGNLSNMNAMSSRLIFRPEGSKFRSGHGVGTRRELTEEWVKWAIIAIRFTKGWYKRRRRRRIELSENVPEKIGLVCSWLKSPPDNAERVGATSIRS